MDSFSHQILALVSNVTLGKLLNAKQHCRTSQKPVGTAGEGDSGEEPGHIRLAVVITFSYKKPDLRIPPT